MSLFSSLCDVPRKLSFAYFFLCLWLIKKKKEHEVENAQRCAEKNPGSHLNISFPFFDSPFYFLYLRMEEARRLRASALLALASETRLARIWAYSFYKGKQRSACLVLPRHDDEGRGGSKNLRPRP